MKKTIILISLIISCFASYAQNELIEKFELSATGNAYGIYTSINCESSMSYDLWIDMQAPNEDQEVQLKMTFSLTSTLNSVNSLTKNMVKAKETFKKWKEIAGSNSLKRMAKKIPVSVADQELYFTQNGKWYSEHGVDMQFTFYVDDEGNCYMLLESDYMTSEEVVAYSSARYSTLGTMTSSTVVKHYCSGAFLIFTTEEEIDQFAAKLDKVIEWKRANVENGKLLK